MDPHGVDKKETEEQPRVPYEQWRDSVTAWMVKEHSGGKSTDEIATALEKLWPREYHIQGDLWLDYWLRWHGRKFYRWYAHRQINLSKNILEKYQIGGKGRPKSLTVRDIYALQAIVKHDCQKVGYKDTTSSIQNGWTIARIQDAMRRWRNTTISGKTLRRVLKQLNYIWNEEKGWFLPLEFQSTPDIDMNLIHYWSYIDHFEDWECSFTINKINQTPPDPSLVDN
jgi:hypothetical protein